MELRSERQVREMQQRLAELSSAGGAVPSSAVSSSALADASAGNGDGGCGGGHGEGSEGVSSADPRSDDAACVDGDDTPDDTPDWIVAALPTTACAKYIALMRRCVQFDRSLRPSMAQVEIALRSIAQLLSGGGTQHSGPN